VSPVIPEPPGHAGRPGPRPGRRLTTPSGQAGIRRLFAAGRPRWDRRPPRSSRPFDAARPCPRRSYAEATALGAAPPARRPPSWTVPRHGRASSGTLLRTPPCGFDSRPVDQLRVRSPIGRGGRHKLAVVSVRLRPDTLRPRRPRRQRPRRAWPRRTDANPAPFAILGRRRPFWAPLCHRRTPHAYPPLATGPSEASPHGFCRQGSGGVCGLRWLTLRRMSCILGGTWFLPMLMGANRQRWVPRSHAHVLPAVAGGLVRTPRGGAGAISCGAGGL
jgi:hypothetical protein